MAPAGLRSDRKTPTTRTPSVARRGGNPGHRWTSETAKLARAKRLTAASTKEQAGAGLDALTDAERRKFEKLNAAYVEKFGFPFIIAVKGLTKAKILKSFEKRIAHDRDAEFAEACSQVERIALLRLREMFRV